MTVNGFLIQAWMHGTDLRLCGRTTEGQSFALSLDPGERQAHLKRHQAGLARPSQPAASQVPAPSAEPPLPVPSAGPAATAPATPAGPWPALADSGFREDEEFLLRLGIRGAVQVSGLARPGQRVDLAFSQASLAAADCRPVARWLGLDIETDREGCVTAVSLVPPDQDGDSTGTGEVHLVWPGTTRPDKPLWPDWIIAHPTERDLLQAVTAAIVRLDPDVITGWNVADFDFAVLAGRCKARQLRFDAGRTRDEEVWVRQAASGLTRVTIHGRQVLDAMRVLRASGERYEDLKLQTVAQAILGSGKTVASSGEDKLAELEQLYRTDPVAFCAYCREDSRLVLRILQKTGLDRLSLERSALTGTSLELAWTSIPAFERIYALELWQRGLNLPPPQDGRLVSGAAGGTVLDPDCGLFHQVWVFDFKSLYPTIMRTFNIDPLSHARALARPTRPDDIVAPNGARFDREPGILGNLISQYFEQRLQAQASGDEVGAYVYKILMNSFYGVLGSRGCRYGRTELAGAITGFGRLFLHTARDFFQDRGYRVLYGDTDSVFVHAGGRLHAGTGSGSSGGAGSGGGKAAGDDPLELARELNAHIAGLVRQRWDRESCLQIRFEKAYAVFLIPRLRSGPGSGGEADADLAVRGRAKGYAGLLAGTADHPEGQVEVKGMEAARSDYTPLAVRFQRELLDRLFHDQVPDEVAAWARGFVADLQAGRLDQELVYRKILRRSARDYTANEPPQVKVARQLGWTDRRGRVAYLMTKEGPMALEHCLAEPERYRPDYAHYVTHQLQPIWDSLADAADRRDRPVAPASPAASPAAGGQTAGYLATRPLDLSAGRGQLELGW